MKTILHLLATAALLGAGLPLFADDARSTGHILLLRSERALEGDIEKLGNRYRIRRGAAEVWVAADQAVRLCADWDDAYRFMQSRANLGDADERLRLARWCRLNGLDAKALAEARVVLRMRPGQPEATHLVALLEQQPSPSKATPAPAPAAPPAPAKDVDLSPEAMITFTNRIQPILMNTCARCHTGAQAGAFRLWRVTECGQHGATQRNLATVLAHVNLEQVAVSALLVKAVSPHGGAAARPLPSKEAAPFQILQAWIELTADTNPHLRSAKSPAPTRLTPEVAASAQPLTASVIVSRPAPAAPTEDVVSPASFNAQMHPGR